MAYTILIADDEAEIRDILHLYLEQAGFHVVEAADGFETLSLLEKEAPDLLLLDIMMQAGWLPGIEDIT
ncbi:MAG: response regulator [Lachnospiraceae bacterium]